MKLNGAESGCTFGPGVVWGIFVFLSIDSTLVLFTVAVNGTGQKSARFSKNETFTGCNSRFWPE
jgi:hypothetical protein